MAVAFIGLGSNLGDRQRYLQSAVGALERIPQTELLRVSPWLETEPIGGPPQGPFLNGVAQVETSLNPKELLDQLRAIEEKLGRPRSHPHWGPRVIDLDLLSYDDLTLETSDLVLPHPRLHLRRFVLEPLAEIAPDWQHPRLGKTARALLDGPKALDADR